MMETEFKRHDLVMSKLNGWKGVVLEAHDVDGDQLLDVQKDNYDITEIYGSSVRRIGDSVPIYKTTLSTERSIPSRVFEFGDYENLRIEDTLNSVMTEVFNDLIQVLLEQFESDDPLSIEPTDQINSWVDHYFTDYGDMMVEGTIKAADFPTESDDE